MDTERLLVVADAIEQSIQQVPSGMNFDMMVFHRVDECGTSACVAGFTLALFSKDKYATTEIPEFEAEVELELSREEAEELFFATSLSSTGTDSYGYGYVISGMEVVNSKRRLVPAALRWMAENSFIHWEQAFHEVATK